MPGWTPAPRERYEPQHPLVDAPSATDDTPPARPPLLMWTAFVTSGLSLLEARRAEVFLALMQDPAPPRVREFKMAFTHAFWLVAQAHPRAIGALEIARLVLATLLFVASLRVLLRVRDTGWLWRQALAGNVAVTFVAAWHEHSLRAEWFTAYQRALASSQVALAPSQKGLPITEAIRLQLTASVMVTGMLGSLLLLALAFATRAQTRSITG